MPTTQVGRSRRSGACAGVVGEQELRHLEYKQSACAAGESATENAGFADRGSTEDRFRPPAGAWSKTSGQSFKNLCVRKPLAWSQILSESSLPLNPPPPPKTPRPHAPLRSGRCRSSPPAGSASPPLRRRPLCRAHLEHHRVAPAVHTQLAVTMSAPHSPGALSGVLVGC